MIFLNLENVKKDDLEVIDFDPELDDERIIFSGLCTQISELGGAIFQVVTDDSMNWPVDVATDLPVLLEQLPQALRAVKTKEKRFSIDFYEQGIESQIIFELSDAGYRISNKGLLVKNDQWHSFKSKNDIENILENIKGKLVNFIEERQPSLLNEPCIKNWIN